MKQLIEKLTKGSTMKMILCLFSLLLASTQLFGESRAATVSAIVGNVKIQRGGNTQWQKASLNMKLYQQDKIRTELGSSCRIEVAQGTFLKVEENTFISLKNLTENGGANKTDVKVWGGSVFAKVDKLKKDGEEFALSTPTVVAGVRGTRLTAKVENGAGKIISDPENEPGSIFVYVPGKEDKGKVLSPGKAVVGRADGTLSKEISIERNETANIRENKVEEQYLQTNSKPVLELSSPAVTKLEGTILRIKGKSTVDAELHIYIEGVEVEKRVLDKPDFEKTISVSNYLGENIKLEVTVIDKYGQGSQISKMISVEEEPLKLKVLAPSKDDFELTENSLVVELETSAGASVSVVLGEKEIASGTAGSDGIYKANIPVKDFVTAFVEAGRPNAKLEISATKDGKTMKRVKVVKFKLPKFEVAISSPDSDKVISTPLLPIRGSSLPNSKVEIFVDGRLVKESLCQADGKFSEEIDFSAFLNKAAVPLLIKITDPSGKLSTTIARSIKYYLEIDILNVAIRNLTPSGVWLPTSEAMVAGKVTPALATLKINGEEVPTQDGLFTKAVALGEGEQKIELELILESVVVKKTLPVRVDSIPPEIESVEVIDETSKSLGAPESEILGRWFTVRMKTSPDVVSAMVGTGAAYKVSEGVFDCVVQVRTEGPLNLPILIVDGAGHKKQGAVPTLTVIGTPSLELISFNDGKLLFGTKPGLFLTVQVGSELYIDNQEVSTRTVQVDLKEYNGDPLFQMTAYAKDKYERQSAIIVKQLFFDKVAPELISEDFLVYQDHYVVVMSWSEPCLVKYYPNGSTGKERVLPTDSSGNVQMKVFFTELDVRPFNGAPAKFTKRLNDTFSRYVQAEDKAGNLSLWYGGSDNAVFIPLDKPPRPPKTHGDF